MQTHLRRYTSNQTGNNSFWSMWSGVWETMYGSTVQWDFTTLFEYCVLYNGYILAIKKFVFISHKKPFWGVFFFLEIHYTWSNGSARCTTNKNSLNTEPSSQGSPHSSPHTTLTPAPRSSFSWCDQLGNSVKQTRPGWNSWFSHFPWIFLP